MLHASGEKSAKLKTHTSHKVRTKDKLGGGEEGRGRGEQER